jgi:hypothetical protein
MLLVIISRWYFENKCNDILLYINQPDTNNTPSDSLLKFTQWPCFHAVSSWFVRNKAGLRIHLWQKLKLWEKHFCPGNKAAQHSEQNTGRRKKANMKTRPLGKNAIKDWTRFNSDKTLSILQCLNFILYRERSCTWSDLVKLEE